MDKTIGKGLIKACRAVVIKLIKLAKTEEGVKILLDIDRVFQGENASFVETAV